MSLLLTKESLRYKVLLDITEMILAKFKSFQRCPWLAHFDNACAVTADIILTELAV
jgi:hypothetical protein